MGQSPDSSSYNENGDFMDANLKKIKKERGIINSCIL